MNLDLKTDDRSTVETLSFFIACFLLVKSRLTVLFLDFLIPRQNTHRP